MNRRSKNAKDDEKLGPCSATKQAEFDPEHTHTCLGNHEADVAHFCDVCCRWWA